MAPPFNLFMNKKNFILIALVLVLAAVYVVCFTDWFRTKPMLISDTKRPMPGVRSPGGAHLTFSLGGDYELTEVKVVPLDALKSNSHAQPLWHLVSDSGSDTVNSFAYGENIGGMDPVVEGSHAEPLKPGVVYRLFVSAGKVRGQHDFQIGVPPANTSTNK